MDRDETSTDLTLRWDDSKHWTHRTRRGIGRTQLCPDSIHSARSSGVSGAIGDGRFGSILVNLTSMHLEINALRRLGDVDPRLGRYRDVSGLQSLDVSERSIDRGEGSTEPSPR
jgi:hypothetical protein